MPAFHDTPQPERDDVRAPLGPPGWDEYVAARRRFTVALALEGLDRMLAAPAADGAVASAREEPSR